MVPAIPSSSSSCLTPELLLLSGSIQIDDTAYDHDVVIDLGEARKRKKKPSKKFRGEYGRTLLSAEEEIPSKCTVWSWVPELPAFCR